MFGLPARYVVGYALSIVCAQQLKASYDAGPVDGWARYHARKRAQRRSYPRAAAFLRPSNRRG